MDGATPGGLGELRRVLRAPRLEPWLALVSFSGVALGLLAALVFARTFPFPPVDYSATGVVGWVTQNQYPKSREQVVYIVAVLLTLGGMSAALAAWLVLGWCLGRRDPAALQQALTATGPAFVPAGAGLLLALASPRYATWCLVGVVVAISSGAGLASTWTRRRTPLLAPAPDEAPEEAPADGIRATSGVAEAAGLVLLAGLAVGFFLPMAIPAAAAPRLAAAWWAWPILLSAAWVVTSRDAARRHRETFERAARRDALAHAPALLLVANPYLVDAFNPRILVTVAALAAFVAAKAVVATRGPFEPPRLALRGCVVAGLTALASLFWLDPNYPGLLVSPGDVDHIIAWLNEGRLGKWVYRDFWFPYGPLMYLLDWTSMRLCGLDRYLLPSRVFSSIVVALMLILGARKVVRTWPFQVFGALFVWFSLYPNSFALRVYLGLAALVCAVRAAGSGRPRWLAAAGALIAVSFLYSQEVGIVVLLAAPPAMVWAAGSLRTGVHAVAWMVAGVAAILVPAAVAAAAAGVLLPYLQCAFGVVSVTDLCCGIAYPSLLRQLPAAEAGVGAVRGLVRVLLGETVRIFYLPPFVLALGAVALVASALRTRGPARREDPVLLGLVLMGLALFRVALGRSEGGHARYAAVPALVVAVVVLERLAIGSWRAWVRRDLWTAAGAAAGVVVLALATRFPVEISRGLRVVAGRLPAFHAEIPRSTAHRPISGWSGIRSRRGELFFFPESSALYVESTRAYLQAHTLPREGVYAFPYAFRYNVLLHRRTPISFGPSLWAAAARPEDRRRVVTELTAQRVRYVVYDESEWADFDGVAWTDRFPEITDHLFDRYAIEAQFGPVSVLRLREGPAAPPPSVIEAGRLDQRLHLTRGWYATQRSGRRTVRWISTTAVARMTLPPGGTTLVLVGQVYPTSPRLERRLSVSVGGNCLGAIELSRHEGAATLRFPVPSTVPRGTVAVRLEVDKPFPGTDPRRLGMVVERLGFE